MLQDLGRHWPQTPDQPRQFESLESIECQVNFPPVEALTR